MLHAFHYEPQGQRQQFEPREAQENLKQRQMHLHFSLDLHLNLGARLRRASRSTIGRVTTIFAAFMGALALGPEAFGLTFRQFYENLTKKLLFKRVRYR